MTVETKIPAIRIEHMAIILKDYSDVESIVLMSFGSYRVCFTDSESHVVHFDGPHIVNANASALPW